MISNLKTNEMPIRFEFHRITTLKTRLSRIAIVFYLFFDLRNFNSHPLVHSCRSESTIFIASNLTIHTISKELLHTINRFEYVLIVLHSSACIDLPVTSIRINRCYRISITHHSNSLSAIKRQQHQPRKHFNRFVKGKQGLCDYGNDRYFIEVDIGTPPQICTVY